MSHYGQERGCTLNQQARDTDRDKDTDMDNDTSHDRQSKETDIRFSEFPFRVYGKYKKRIPVNFFGSDLIFLVVYGFRRKMKILVRHTTLLSLLNFL